MNNRTFTFLISLLLAFPAMVYGIRGGAELPQSQLQVEQKRLIESSVVQLFSVTDAQSLYACSGTIISDHYVLTSAHCFDTGHRHWRIHHLNETYEVSAVGIHKAYRREEVMDAYWNFLLEIRLHNDLALVKTAEKLKGRSVSFAETFNVNSTPPVVLAGFGQTEHLFGIGQGEGVLRVAGPLSLKTVEQKRIAIKNQPMGGCLGDSGGPLLADQNGQLNILGVLSQSDCLGNTTYQRVFNDHLAITAFDWGPLVKRKPRVIKE